MKETGHPDHAGETLTQSGTTAVAVEVDGALIWRVTAHDGVVAITERLAHTGHWSPA